MNIYQVIYIYRMKNMLKNRSIRILKFFTCLFILVTVLFSYHLFASEADHDCCKEGCPICEHIERSKECVRRYSQFLLAVFYLAVSFRLLYWKTVLLSERKVYFPPATYKIRFNN